MNKDNIAILISIVTLIVTIFFSTCALIKSCRNEESLERLNSISFQPRIKIIGTPPIVISSVDSIAPADNDSVLVLLGTKIQIKMDITNIGNSKAIVNGVIYSDTTSAVELIREIIYSREIKLGEFFPPFFQNELLPDTIDTVKVTFEKKIQFIKDDVFTLHFLFLYENELGNLYDTYYWAQYRLIPFALPITEYLISKEQIVGFKAEKAFATKDIIEYLNTKSSYYIYSKNEKKLLEQKLNDLKYETETINYF